MSRRSPANEPQPLRLELRGANLELFESHAREVIVSGPTRTGKSIGCLSKIDYLMRSHPFARALIVRKTRESLNDSILPTLEDEILLNDPLIVGDMKHETRRQYIYPNGSTISIAGLTQSNVNNRAKLFSTKYDVIYIPEAIEIELDDYEKLLTRLASYIVPYQQIIGDTNPDSPLHWLWSRSQSKRLALLHTTHKDNPKWWIIDPADPLGGHWTPQGIDYIENTIGSLTGVMAARYGRGEWVSSEGMVYAGSWIDGAPSGNVTTLAEYEPGVGSVYWFADDGYSAGSAAATRGLDRSTGEFVGDSHPRVFLLVQEKPDGHLDVFAEDYACLQLSDDHIERVKALGYTNEQGDHVNYPEPEFVSHGPGAAEFRGRIHAANMAARQCTAQVKPSIQQLRSALSPDRNGFRRVRVHPRCRHLRAEMVAYANKSGTDDPVKQFDHGADAIRGGVWVLRNNFE